MTARASRSRICASAAAVALGLTMAMVAQVAQRCFLNPTPPMPKHVDAALTVFATETEFASSALLAGSEVLPLRGEDRDVRVAMYNKKRTKRDRSEGWTVRRSSGFQHLFC